MEIVVHLTPAQVTALENQRMQQRGANSLPTSPDLATFFSERVGTLIVAQAMQMVQNPELVQARMDMDRAQMAYQIAQAQLSQVTAEVTVK